MWVKSISIAALMFPFITACGASVKSFEQDSVVVQQCRADFFARDDAQYRDIRSDSFFQVCLVSKGFAEAVSDELVAECSVYASALYFELSSEGDRKYSHYDDVWGGVYSDRVEAGGRAYLEDDDFIRSIQKGLGLDPDALSDFVSPGTVSKILKKFRKCEKFNLAAAEAASKEEFVSK